VVRSVPDEVMLREMTSHERTWDAYGLGYRMKNARETIDQGSSYNRDCVKNLIAHDPGTPEAVSD